MLQSFNINDIYTEIMSSVLADNTRIAYDKGWQLWQRYCDQNNLTADEIKIIEGKK